MRRLSGESEDSYFPTDKRRHHTESLDEEFLSNPENELVGFATTWPEQNYSQVQERGIKHFLHQHPDTLRQKCVVKMKCIGESGRN